MAAGRLMFYRIWPIACFAVYVTTTCFAVAAPLKTSIRAQDDFMKWTECKHYRNSTSVIHDVFDNSVSMMVADHHCNATDHLPSKLKVANIRDEVRKGSRTLTHISIDAK